ncbi:MAG: nodulation protein NfeD [Proteobacteria bacterium]|nr:nodulation protein NfeD [Pseudomonadota bacterium]
MRSSGSYPPTDPGRAAPRTAVVIALEGAIGPATAAYVVRSLQAAEHDGAAVAVLRLDTPGGLDSAMRDIIRAMLASPVPVLAFVAPSGARAASAGTYILYASALAAMTPGTNLGAATPVSLFGNPPAAPGTDKGADKKPAGDGDKREAAPLIGSHDAMTAKATNDAAAYIRGLATMHGRNADWAERAVREAVSLPYDAALAQRVIDVVATSEADLLKQVDGRTVMVLGKKIRLATAGLEIVTVEPTWRDQMLGLLTNPNVVYLLLLAGLMGVAFELTHPGVIAPGVVGTICLLVGGYGLNLLPIDYAGVALALLGIGLMVAEAFVPAFGALGLGGAAAFAIGSLMMFENPDLRPPISMIVGATLASTALFAVVLALLLRARRRPVVTGNAVLVGALGQTTRWAGAEGEVMVHGERWQARAARPLAPGQAVKVVDRQGLTLVVEPT